MQYFAKPAAMAALLLLSPVTLLAQETTPAASAADPAETMQIELNSAVPNDAGGCRLTMVTTNRMPQGLARAAWQVAIFDGSGQVQALPVLDFGALTSGKTKIGLFELPGRACDDISRIVINDVAECRAEDDSDQREACLAGLVTQNRTDIEFGL